MKRALLVVPLVMISACGSDAVDPSAPDGELDCSGTVQTAVYDYGPDAEGSVTPFEAMQAWAEDSDLGPEWSIHVVDARTGTVVVNGSEVAEVLVDELATETFAHVQVTSCPGFEGP